MKTALIKLGLQLLGIFCKQKRNTWAEELKKKGLLFVLIALLPMCAGCSDGFKLWYVNTYDTLTGYKEPVAVENYEEEQQMITAESRLNHLVIPADQPPSITIKGYSKSGITFNTQTFDTARNDLSKDYETLILTRFKDGQQKVFGTSWPAADSRAFKDNKHTYTDVDRFMIVLNQGRVNKNGHIIGKAKLIEYSKVIKL